MGQRLKSQELPFWFLWIQNGNLANGEELSKFTGETGQFADLVIQLQLSGSRNELVINSNSVLVEKQGKLSFFQSSGRNGVNTCFLEKTAFG